MTISTGPDLPSPSAPKQIPKTGSAMGELQRIALKPIKVERIITTNCIPAHKVGHYPVLPANPNEIKAQDPKLKFTITANPGKASSTTSLLWDEEGKPDYLRPRYMFGVTLAGLILDPIADAWWDPSLNKPFQNTAPNIWNFEALNIKGHLGMDCNAAHPNGDGVYHYHGLPVISDVGMSGGVISGVKPTVKRKMILVGYAADGYKIYYKYGYKSSGPLPPSSATAKSAVEMKPSYKLRTGERKNDYTTDVPCGSYNGLFTLDYEYEEGLGDLDECNGREGWTDDGFTYYYVLTDDFPVIPRCFRGTPSEDFAVAH